MYIKAGDVTNFDICHALEKIQSTPLLKPSQNKKGRKNFQLHRFLNTLSQVPAVKKYSKTVQLEKFWAFLF